MDDERDPVGRSVVHILNQRMTLMRIRTAAGILMVAASLCQFPVEADDRVCDMGAAREYCNTHALSLIEGVWEFPEDATSVLIRHSEAGEYAYEMILISSPDCRLDPGERIGWIEETAEADKYRIRLYCDRREGLLTDLRHCVGKLNDKEGTLCIDPRKIRVSLRNTRYLPQFWRMLNVKITDPQARLPIGLRRIFPAYDGNDSRPGRPRYL